MRLQSIWNPNTLTVGVSALLERPSVWDKLLLTYLLTYLLTPWCRCYNFKFSTFTSSFERVEEFKYMGRTITNQNSIQEEIESRLK